MARAQRRRTVKTKEACLVIVAHQAECEAVPRPTSESCSVASRTAKLLSITAGLLTKVSPRRWHKKGNPIMKKFAMLSLLILTSLSASDEFVQFRGNMYISCTDSFPVYDTSIITRIAGNLGMERMDRIHPDFKTGFRNRKLRWIIAYTEVKADRRFLHQDLSGLNARCTNGDSILLTGFRLSVPDFKRVRNNLFEFITSAYEQEINPSIKNAEGGFIILPEKPEDKVIRYNWISPGYAMNYLYDCNPFSSLNPALQIGYYLMDAIGLAYAVAGPILAKSTKDKLVFSGLGLAFLAEIRLLSSFALRREVQGYNMIRNSPYRVPSTVRYRGCR